MFHELPNTFRDDLKPKFGIPTIQPKPGESFDKNNDLWLGDDGRTVYHRDGHISYGGAVDAILDYDKRHMTASAFNEYYGDDNGCEEEFYMLNGCG